MRSRVKSLVVVAVFLAGLGAHAHKAGAAYLEKIQDGVRTGVEACGLVFISGQDSRLDWQLRARRVDSVIAKVAANGALVPGVLIDREISGDALTLSYSRTNGGLIFQVSQDYDFNDVQVTTSRDGVVAYTNSYWRGQNLQRDYFVKVPYQGTEYVTQSFFERYINDEVMKGFVKFVCGQTTNPF